MTENNYNYEEVLQEQNKLDPKKEVAKAIDLMLQTGTRNIVGKKSAQDDSRYRALEELEYEAGSEPYLISYEGNKYIVKFSNNVNGYVIERFDNPPVIRI